jgi:hypothetical protein
MAVNTKQEFRRGQVARFIELCGEKLDQIFFECKSQKGPCLFFEYSLSYIVDNSFENPTDFSRLLQSDAFYDKHVFEQIVECVEVVLGESENYPLPLFYPDGAGDLLEPIETLEIDRMKKEIQKGVIYKIQHLLQKIEFLDEKDEKAKQQVVKASFHTELSDFFAALPQEIKDLPDVAKMAISMHPQTVRGLCESTKSKEHIVFSACLKAPEMFAGVSEEMKENKVFVLKLIQALKERVILLFPHLGAVLQNDFATVWKAIQKNPKCYLHLSERLKENQDILFYIVKHEPSLVSMFPQKILKNQRLLSSFLKINPRCQDFLGK